MPDWPFSMVNIRDYGKLLWRLLAIEDRVPATKTECNPPSRIAQGTNQKEATVANELSMEKQAWVPVDQS